MRRRVNQSLRESGAAVQGREDGGLNPARIDLLRASEGQRRSVCAAGTSFTEFSPFQAHLIGAMEPWPESNSPLTVAN